VRSRLEGSTLDQATLVRAQGTPASRNRERATEAVVVRFTPREGIPGTGILVGVGVVVTVGIRVGVGVGV